MEAATYIAYLPILVGMVAVYLGTIHICRKLQKRPPSPFVCFPVTGHLYVLKNPVFEAFTNLANRFGPIVFLWFGSRPALFVSSPSGAEDCLNKNDIVFCNRPSPSLAGKYRGHDFGGINFSPYGPHWKNLRKIATVHLLSFHRLKSLASIRSDELRLLIKRLCSSEVTEMRPQIFDTTLNIMTRMIFGERYYGLEECSEKGKRIREFVVESIMIVFIPCIGDDIPYLKWLDWKMERKYKEYKEKRDKLMKELIEEHRSKTREMRLNSDVVNQDTIVKPMIQSLFELQESDPECYKDHVLCSIIADLLIGSSETTINTMEWALALLLNHPEVLSKVRTEIDKQVGYARFVEEGDLEQLPYLGCVLNETLRMHPPLPILFPHESSKDCVVGGYRIPRGTFLLVNVYGIQNDPKIWDSPNIFRPERFEGVEAHKFGYKMMPFGSGRRRCPGEGLAIRVMGMMLAILIQCLDLERVDDKLLDMAQLHRFNLQKAEPLFARIQPRQVMINLLRKL